MGVKILQLLFVYINVAIVTFGVDSIDIMCNRTEYFDPGVLSCQSCPVNVSMVASADGFSCVCEEDSIPVGVERCRKCNATEVLSADGTACVPRKCQGSSGRFVCRKCPADYISVTQNFDGSTTKEVLCVKCARGYKAYNNVCVHCPSCVCAKNEVAVRGACVTKKFVSDRPKYEGTMHSTALLDVIKHEFLCTNGDLLSCRALAQECVKNFYTEDVSGPCRLWVQPKMASPKGLPELVVLTKNDMKPGEFILPYGKDSLLLLLAVYTANGGLKILESPEKPLYKCFLPIEVSIGKDFTRDCEINLTELMLLDSNSTYSVYLSSGGVLKPLPIVMQKPGGYFVKVQTWSSKNLRRFFLVYNFVTSNNASSSIYLRTLFLRIGLERDKYQSTSLRVRLRVEAQYTSKSALSSKVVTTLRVEHEMPSAGMLRGLEIWGGVLGCLSSLYALVQWRGETRRGGLQCSLIPHLAGCLSDALYFAAFFSTIHALAAEAGTIGITLPLSAAEEHVIKAFIYSTLSLKAIKLAWLTWKQCSCNIFFLDWSEYNSTGKDALSSNRGNDWRLTTLAKEWSRLQTLRYAPPIYTTVLTLVVLRLMTSWQHHIGQSQGYKWAAGGIAWWVSYAVVLVSRWVSYKVTSSPPTSIPKTCKAVGVSLLVFEEEYYAHYVHGRISDDKDIRLMSGPISMCRVVMAPQLRTVCNQLSSTRHDDINSLEKQALLSRLLAAFFERALDGLNWVASERGLLERLLGVELTDREGGSTSVLLYDVGETVPSCTAVTWWGIEWSLGCMDAMLFGAVVFATEDPAVAALLTLVVWQFYMSSGLRYKSSSEDEMELPPIKNPSELIMTSFNHSSVVLPNGPFYGFLVNICDALLHHFYVDRVHKYFKILSKSLNRLGSGFYMKMKIHRFAKKLKKRSVLNGNILRLYVQYFFNYISSGKRWTNEFFYAMNSIFTLYDDNKMDEYVYFLERYGRNEIRFISSRTRSIFKKIIFYKVINLKEKNINDIQAKFLFAFMEFKYNKGETYNSTDFT